MDMGIVATLDRHSHRASHYWNSATDSVAERQMMEQTKTDYNAKLASSVKEVSK